jgi:periplasmic protein TonB
MRVRMLAVVLVAGLAQAGLALAGLGQGATPSLPPAAVPATLKMASAGTVSVPENVLQGLAENEPDIAAPEGGVQNGDMWLRVLVSKTGAVEEATASRADEAPRQAAAVDGVMGWRYRPYVMNGQAREIQSTIMLSFHDGEGKRAVFGRMGGPPVAQPLVITML